jgi:2-oxoglutarate dehydrogenase E2 component (dihydrolipoamide succinyltransferase)
MPTPSAPSVNVDVPALGESVREAVLIKWHKNDGDAVAAAEPIAELETDKANVDVPAPSAGVLRRVKNEGDTVAIGDTIARIEAGNGVARAAPAAGAGAAAKNQSASSAAASTTPAAAASSPASAAAAAASSGSAGARPQDLRPSVRRIVEESKLDAAGIKGSGPGGKILKEDAQAKADGKSAGTSPASATAPASTAASAPASTAAPESRGPGGTVMSATPAASAASGDGTRTVPMTRIRRKIAERLVQAQQTAAILTVTRSGQDVPVPADLETNIGEIMGIVRHVADVAAALGDRLRAGQFIICGSLTAPMFLEPEDTGVEFALDPIGAISVRFL